MQAVKDLVLQPNRPSSREHSESNAPGIRSYHMELSKTRVVGQRVRSPRHLLVYQVLEEGEVEILRILHDARRLPAKYRVK